jgi:hypothetical protein
MRMNPSAMRGTSPKATLMVPGLNIILTGIDSTRGTGTRVTTMEMACCFLQRGPCNTTGSGPATAGMAKAQNIGSMETKNIKAVGKTENMPATVCSTMQTRTKFIKVSGKLV